MEIAEHIEVLLAEDSPLDAELTMRALKKARLGNKVVWVKDGQEALDYLFRKGEYAQREDTLPRLIFLDLKMPRVDGIEVLRAIKTEDRTKRIPVVVMTSSEEERDIALSYDLGVNSYVVKPIDPDGLTDVVKQAGYYWLAVNRTASQ
jgi:two-component system response regulator